VDDDQGGSLARTLGLGDRRGPGAGRVVVERGPVGVEVELGDAAVAPDLLGGIGQRPGAEPLGRGQAPGP
jgi:hypothetical protein